MTNSVDRRFAALRLGKSSRYMCQVAFSHEPLLRTRILSRSRHIQHKGCRSTTAEWGTSIPVGITREASYLNCAKNATCRVGAKSRSPLRCTFSIAGTLSLGKPLVCHMTGWRTLETEITTNRSLCSLLPAGQGRSLVETVSTVDLHCA